MAKLSIKFLLVTFVIVVVVNHILYLKKSKTSEYRTPHKETVIKDIEKACKAQAKLPIKVDFQTHFKAQRVSGKLEIKNVVDCGGNETFFYGKFGIKQYKDCKGSFMFIKKEKNSVFSLWYDEHQKCPLKDVQRLVLKKG